VHRSAYDALKAAEVEVNQLDPFVQWLCTGAFVYFDFKFDIVAINAMSFDELGKEQSASAIYYGEPCELPIMAIEPLHDLGRWWPISVGRLRKTFGFTHFAWVVPSEFLGDHIFTNSGGFAYLHEDDYSYERDVTGDGELDFTITGNRGSRFYPIVRNEPTVDHATRRVQLEGNMGDTAPLKVPKSDLGQLPLAEGLEIVRLMLERSETVRG
jgi:hypothetical protein